jgi:hypothetical protein
MSEKSLSYYLSIEYGSHGENFAMVFRKSLSGVPAALPSRLFRLLNDAGAFVFHRRTRRNSSVSLQKKRTGLCFDCQSSLLANITVKEWPRFWKRPHTRRKKYRLQAYTGALPMAFSAPLKKWRKEYA